LRLVTLANARPGAAAAVAHLRARGVAVALGHCDRTAGFVECADAGATAVTHLFNVMGALHHREVGVAGLALDDERLACPLILDGVHVHPAMVRNAFRILGPDRMVLVTDAVGAAGMPDGEYHLAGIRVFAQDGVVRDGEGRLAGSALTMGHCARNFLQFLPRAGVWSLARAASGNPARLAGVDDRYGSLAPGRAAAFTLLGDDGAVRCVRSR
jgi:N-acetylglucosamine-6-phosphate deacetylase